MAVFALTDVGRVKALLDDPTGAKTAEWDTLITATISAVSEAIAADIGRPILKAAYVQALPVVREGQRVISLDAYPVDTAVSFVVKQDSTRGFASGTAIDATRYYVDGPNGQVHLDDGLDAGRGTVRVEYTGGLAADLAALDTSYPAIVRAATLAAKEVFERRHALVKTGESLGGNSISWSEALSLFPKVVRELIAPYRRAAFDA